MSRRCDEILVVVVDDDASFRTGVAANLEDDGHAVLVFEDPRDVPPDVVAAAQVIVTDYQMADVDGLTFADGVEAARGGLGVILATAYWTREIEAAVADRPWLRLCRKPASYEELHALVHQIAPAPV